MEERTKLETSRFESAPYPSGSGRRFSYRAAAGENRRSKPKRLSGNAKYFLVRLGVCAAIFGTVLYLKLGRKDNAIAVIGELTDNKGTEENEGESRLGKLRFVELPSILDVFAHAKTALLPVEAESFDIAEGGVLRLNAGAGALVVSPLEGKVASVGIDDALGRFVSIKTDGDVEFTLFGLGGAAVEKGQPVTRGQRIGELLGDALSVRVYSGGRPVDAAEFFELGKAS